MSGHILQRDIDEARAADIRVLWQRLGLPALPERGNARSPFRPDDHPTCEVGGPKNIFHDFGTGETLDTIALARKAKQCGFAAAVLFILGRPAPVGKSGKPERRIAATYDYHKEDGALNFQVVRYEPKAFAQRRPDGHGGWLWNLDGVRRTLYRRDEVVRAIEAGRRIYVVEGEKDVERLRGEGLAATCWAGGAGKFAGHGYEDDLRGAEVVVIPDNDEAGERSAEQVAAAVHGLAQSVKVLRLEGLPPKGDASDWLDQGHTAKELERLADAAPEWTPARNNSRGQMARNNRSLDRPELTDLGNAERFRAQHGDSVLFDPSAGWRFWDGRRWALDSSGEVQRRAHATARSFLEEAAAAPSREEAQKIALHAIKTQYIGRLRAMVDVAQSLMTAAPSQFDADSWALNCLNGTVDLRTGKLRPHRPEDLITRLAPVDYNPAATHPVFERVLGQAMPDAELRRYAQKLFGVTLVGQQLDDFFVMMYGPGNTAKTTVIEPFKKLLGDYAATVEPESLMVGRGGSGAARGDIARLNGVRLALTTEVENGAKLAVGLIKRLCGGDTITTRRLYRDEFEFTPVFTLWIVSNHRPKADSDDDGLWRRVRVLPFSQVIPEEQRDPYVKQAMVAECLPAFLRWAVAGLRLFQEEGLKTPEAVKSATRGYRESQDPLKPFLDACCLRGPGHRVDNTKLRQAYLEFCLAEGIRYPLTPKAFGERLHGLGFQPFKSGSMRGWEGLTLTQEPDGTDGTCGADGPTTFSGFSYVGEVSDSSASTAPSVPTPAARALLDRLAQRGVGVRLDEAGRVCVVGQLGDRELQDLKRLNGAVRAVLAEDASTPCESE